jgi:hypothetical protein
MGYSPEISDALVFIDPKAVSAFFVLQKAATQNVLEGGQPQSVKMDLSRALVYRAKDLIEISNELRNVLQIAINFSLLAGQFFAGDQERAALLALPQIQNALRSPVGRR